MSFPARRVPQRLYGPAGEEVYRAASFGMMHGIGTGRMYLPDSPPARPQPQKQKKSPRRRLLRRRRQNNKRSLHKTNTTGSPPTAAIWREPSTYFESPSPTLTSAKALCKRHRRPKSVASAASTTPTTPARHLGHRLRRRRRRHFPPPPSLGRSIIVCFFRATCVCSSRPRSDCHLAHPQPPPVLTLLRGWRDAPSANRTQTVG